MIFFKTLQKLSEVCLLTIFQTKKSIKELVQVNIAKGCQGAGFQTKVCLKL